MHRAAKTLLDISMAQDMFECLLNGSFVHDSGVANKKRSRPSSAWKPGAFAGVEPTPGVLASTTA
jgi:hypothetical protein